jgi:hypothetical protein
MRGAFLKGAVVGLVCAVLGGATVALAGSGIGGVFNLGQSNSVDAKTALTGASPSAQLQVTNTSAAGGTSGLAVNSGSGATTGVFTNTGGGPAGGFFVSAGVKPFTVNSQTKVGNLNADLLDGLDSPSLQQRVTGMCAVGTAVRVVNANGTVACQAVGTGATGWGLTGNAGTTEGTNFLGTTDAHDLVVKTNGSEVFRATRDGDLGVGTTAPTSKLQAVSSGSGATLAASNTGAGSAAEFQVAGLVAPFTVNSTVKVTGLNADQVDGASIVSNRVISTTQGDHILDIPGFGFIYVDGCDHTNTRWIWTSDGTGNAYLTLFDLANPGDGLFQGAVPSIASATRPHKYDLLQLARESGSTTSIAQVTLTTDAGSCAFAASAIVQPG